MAPVQEFDDYGSKEQVFDRPAKRIKSLAFGILSAQEVVAQSVVGVTDRNLYDLERPVGKARQPTAGGPLDRRLGTSSKSDDCTTCGQGLKECNGHFGHVQLALPVFHFGFLKKIIETLNCICKDCCRVLVQDDVVRSYHRQLRRPGLEALKKDAICKAIIAECKKQKICPHCHAYNGPVKKVVGHPIKLTHNKWAKYTMSNAKSKTMPADLKRFDESFAEAKAANAEVERNFKRVTDDMNPLRVLHIFKKVPSTDVELLGMDPVIGGRPENMIWSEIPAPPVAIRPSVAQEAASTEDDVTNKIGDVLHINNLIRAGLVSGHPISKLMELWEFLQIQLAMYIDGNLPGLGRDSAYGKTMRGFVQRLKGKQGRFRGNLSGKRVDFSGRTVISPDPNLGIDEVAVPIKVAVNMTYPEKVNQQNIAKLRDCVKRGARVHPGANFIIKGRDGRRIVLKMVTSKEEHEKLAGKLEIGDTVERHLEDGDIVLFNRQPSLHKLSILSHRVKVRPWRTFRLNECVCNPYNADFDGDEMNLHVPQTEEARTEALELMGVKHNLATPKNGTPIIAAIQDFITCSFLISRKDRFFNRAQFTQIVSYMYQGMVAKDPYNGKEFPIQIPHPAVYKPQRLWTGKQIWGMLMKPHPDYPVTVNLDAKCKSYVAPEPGTAPDMSETDCYLVIRNSEVMCGVMDKATVGDGKKDSVFYVIMRDFGPDYAAAAMNRLAKLSARWLGEQGFSLGISDVYPSDRLRERKQELVNIAYRKCTALIDQFRRGELERDAGCDEEMTLENRISGILSKVRQECGDACFAELSINNAPLTMAKCGSKGSLINVSQMVAAVGQQIIGGKRVLDGFQDRSLPHFPKLSREPPAKGFVVNSFFSGLNPTEFIFHAMSGREGLVDTAVKTAETGYMSRRLMKSLEDLSTQYDNTVRISNGGLVQMNFGDDGLDPVDMEGSAKPVNFERTLSHALSSTWDNNEKGLKPAEIKKIVKQTLDKERAKIQRYSDSGERLAFDDQSDRAVDQKESVRNFLATVEDFIGGKVADLVNAQKKYNKMGAVFKISQTGITTFLNLCLHKFEKSKVEAGHAVGAVGAQSIGEPGTQMTLKTFHFAGVAGMSITQGVPRIKEIINASKVISTPVISCALDSPYEAIAARMAKALIQKTYLKDIVVYLEDMWGPDGGHINMRIDWTAVRNLGLRVQLGDIMHAIMTTKGMKQLGVIARNVSGAHIRVTIAAEDPKGKPRKRTITRSRLSKDDDEPTDDAFMQLQYLMRRLPDVVIKGYPDAQRAIMKKADKADATGREPISVLVEGYGLKACMTTEGVNGIHTTTNSVMECCSVLGIEAARFTIINEISSVMSGMDIDPRHMQLLADVMTYKGDVLGITRFGLAKMRESVLQLASFEKTADHLFEAGAKMKEDVISGVSECIIMGQTISLGTGGVDVIRPLGLTAAHVSRKPEVGFKQMAEKAMISREKRLRDRMRKMVAAAA
ncbi:hypothetical protein AMS68_005526 [Peltaster fructicola]|uniref:DNA-directed RNA polymerase subunit n=1 Tax=Peltaster fructicola TaxID=286661 RepID=A0A6H0XZG7_9PEZI|nr:hypothetical protein AMS68_005526 [Peltaster fructicola]